MICPHCQSQNREGAHFCDECGSPLQSERIDGEGSDSGEQAFDTSETPAEEDISDTGALSTQSTGRIDLASVPEVIEEASDEAALNEGDTEAFADGEADVLDSGVTAALGSGVTAALSNGAAATLSSDATAALEIPQSLASENTQSLPSVDLSGLDECLVEEGYVPPQANWKSGDTMQMPRVEGAQSAQPRDFRAPDANEKKGFFARRRAKKAEKAAAAEAARKEASASNNSASAASLSGDVYPSDHTPSSTPENTSRKRSGKSKVVVGAIVLLLVVGAAGGALTYSLEMWGGKTIPDVVGLTQADAIYLLESKGFSVRETQVKSDETEGLVLLVDPSVGARAAEGSEVVIHISQSRSIPDVTGKTKDDALALLADEGFEDVSVETQKSDDEENIVVGITPEAGQKAKANAAITLTVTVGYYVPDIAGMNWNEAISALQEEGYSYSVEYVYDESSAEGNIVGTSPAAGERLTSGSTVTMQITKSRGRELEEAARSFLQEAGSVTIGGTQYTITSVDAVSYLGNDTTSFTITGAAVTVLDGETVYGSSKQKSGSIVWDSNNNVVSIS